MQRNRGNAIYNPEYDTKGKFKLFFNTLSYYFDICFPNVRKDQKKETTVNTGLNNICGQKLIELYKNTHGGAVEIIQCYNKYKRLYRILLNNAKKQYNSNFIENSSNKSKLAWNIIRQQMNQVKKLITSS